MSSFYNITGSTGVTVELKAQGDETTVTSLMLTNIHSSTNATVTLFIENDPNSGVTSNFKIINTLSISPSVTLLLDKNTFPSFDIEYGLYITVGSSDTVDVIINN